MAFDIHKLADLDLGDTVRRCSTIEGFSDIETPGCGAVILDRTPLQASVDWLAQLSSDALPEERIVLKPSDVEAHVEGLMPISAEADGDARSWLIQDIAALAQGFAKLMEAPYLRLRLDPIKTNACRKFHIDAVTARLVCTYRGQPTQYGIGNAEREVSEIASVPAACPVILRGTRWPGDAPTGLLHRSPPIEGTGETRLLLVLDPVYRLEDGY
ncbi:DUF1826 domain-containing protein [Cognatishimia sp.]|uniref:DUF1826 domain-containing protein n=1 Tax=Cognatishimia sp. TaxID=2211648 RepID=UPI003515BE05|nr:DUF1826 domain-containing protein [Cognatishimia sp.]